MILVDLDVRLKAINRQEFGGEIVGNVVCALPAFFK